eukprot:gnl/Carplike_NY0171/1469_a1998_1005.p1 GENE.gnl/Carplike_NY0171/1469_a1998_1005~~gnl/Carplike_NY0171/1469_a1998_1005.p1  ORF type:complete len:385 (-),score=162.16 gnl/Carplike_NY0171/1469_a1998_1005:108-1166(-)
MIKTNSIFASNEDLDDISTSSLRYLLVPFYKGLLLGLQMEQRVLAIKFGIKEITAFLTRMDDLKLLERIDKQGMDGEIDKMGGVEQRQARIAQFKAEKQATEMLQLITQRRRAVLARVRRGGLTTKEEIEEDEEHHQQIIEDEEEELDVSSIETEVERDYWIKLLKFSVKKAVKELRALKEELPLAEMSDHFEEHPEEKEAMEREEEKKREARAKQFEAQVAALGLSSKRIGSIPITRIDETYADKVKKLQEDIIKKKIPLDEYRMMLADEEEKREQDEAYEKMQAFQDSRAFRVGEELGDDEIAAMEREREKERLEKAVEVDDETERTRMKQEDEYREDHPRGCGNRKNMG